jgi:outer membrane protein
MKRTWRLRNPWRRTAWALATAGVYVSSPSNAQVDPAARSISLGEAVSLAVAAHPTTRAATLRARSADADVDVARAAYLPTLSTSGLAGVTGVDQPVVPDLPIRVQSANGLVQGSVNLQMTLLDFGRTAAAVRAARGALSAAEAEVAEARCRSALDAAERYIAVASDQQSETAVREVLAQRKETERVVVETVALGLRPPLDERRARLEVDTAELDIAAAQFRTQADVAALATTLGLDPLTRLSIQSVDDSEFEVDEDPALAEISAERNRPETASARARLARASAQLDSAGAQASPALTVAVSGTVTHTTVLAGVGLAGSSENGQVALNVNWPLLDPAVGARRRSAEATVGVAEEELRAQLLAARTQAVRAVLAVRESRLLFERAQTILSDAKLISTLARERYKRGLAPMIDELIDAEGRERAATDEVVRAKFALSRARVELLAAVTGPAVVDRLRSGAGPR